MVKELLFLHGRPASGKDTQADLIVESTSAVHKISGVYRSAFTRVGEHAKFHDLVAPYMKPLGNGIDIPGKTVMDILEHVINDRSAMGDRMLLLCGLIRTIDHKNALDLFLADRRDLATKHIYFATPETMSIEHAQKRIHDDRKKHKERQDDKVELMKARLDRYKINTIPMLKALEIEGKLKVIRADRTISEVNSDFKNYITSETIMDCIDHSRAQERV